MKNTIPLTIVLFLSLLYFVTGCSTTIDTQSGKGKGVAYIYEGSLDKVWNNVPRALSSVGPTSPRMVENNMREGYIFAQGNTGARNVSFGLSGTLTVNSYGQNVLIFVEKLDDHRTSVEVVSDPFLTTKVLAADWSPRIHRKLSETLKRVP